MLQTYFDIRPLAIFLCRVVTLKDKLISNTDKGDEVALILEGGR